MFNFKLFKRKKLISPAEEVGKHEKKKKVSVTIPIPKLVPDTEVLRVPKVNFRTGSLITRFDFLCQNTIYSSRFMHLTIFLHFSGLKPAKLWVFANLKTNLKAPTSG